MTGVQTCALPIYVHRIGRTGRGGEVGTAISLVCALEASELFAIERLIQADIQNVNPCLHILSTVRKLERTGDQVKNIAEEIIFYLEAKVLKHLGD